jgi:hypothetical protein
MKTPAPGVSRENRISDVGLKRLEDQLASGVNISDHVLAQWIRRYGEPAKQLIRQYGRYDERFERIE